jgi:hypothetical protein
MHLDARHRKHPLSASIRRLCSAHAQENAFFLAFPQRKSVFSSHLLRVAPLRHAVAHRNALALRELEQLRRVAEHAGDLAR